MNLSRAEVDKHRMSSNIKRQQMDDSKNEYANQLQKTNELQVVLSRVSDPGFFQIPDPGVCTPNGDIFSHVYELNVLDIIKRHIFCFYTFVVRRPLKALEPRIRIRSEFPPDPDRGSNAFRGRLATKV